ncbi:YggS family pyridoxal phosphate-dependent enzyme [Clostridium mediterraneense]|uniref:YggS family pyridoxal phosphate-dependent enzyme n=1 Tax=Clostridium mediterraneense TaxID=1805472 RepID=UPI0008322150|nr:YggS family pyridoxal phosphate-dependent enzyme [Clostridium mediterraneense]
MNIKDNIRNLLDYIPDYVNLIAVSKTKPLKDLEEAYKCGIRDFGENKVQELCDKYENFHKDVRWHLIGHLQKNKVKYIVGKVHLIHSLDSISLVKELEKRFSKENIVANTLIQLNIGRESQKYGVLEEDIYDIIKEIEKCNNILVKGLMVIIPKGSKEENIKYFKKTKEIFEILKNQEFNNISMEILSMGMTHDYEEAIDEGSNLIRVGEGIFGKRNYIN